VTDRPRANILDVMMPTMDGFGVCRRLQADPATRDLPVVTLTAGNDQNLN
jgi:putative two-component system response regulator